VIELKSPAQIAHMREAGQILVDAFRMCRDLVKPGVSTLEIDREVEALIRERKAKPAFKGYRGFPATICASINQEVVHGIPAPRRRLREGDIIGLDLGAVVEGYYADAAVTLPVGDVTEEVRRLLDVTRESLDRAIAECRPGRRLGDVSAAVQRHVEAAGFGVVRAFVATASAARSTRTRRCRTSGSRGAARSSGPGWCSPSSPWSRWGTGRCGCWRTGGRR
jgi:methionyl aminopeptidase